MSTARNSIRACIIVSLATSFYLYEFFLRVMPSVITTELAQDFHLNQQMLGLLMASFFYAYAIMQIPAGLMCDRYGPKLCLTTAMLTCAGATYIFQSTDQYTLAVIARLSIGAVSACAFVGPLTLAARWFDQKYQALIAGLVQVMGCVGAILAGAPTALLVHSMGWRSCLFTAACLGFLLALSFIACIQDNPTNNHSTAEVEDQISVTECLQAVCSNPQTWSIGILVMGVWAPIAIFAESFGIDYLCALQGIGREVAASQLMWVWIAMAISSPIAGWWSDYSQSRLVPIFTLTGIGFVASILLVYPPLIQNWFICSLLFGLGVGSSAQPITFGLINDINAPSNTGTAVAFNNMALIASAMILQPLTGYLLDILQGVSQVATLSDYQTAFLCVPLMTLLSAIIGFCTVRETHCKYIPHGYSPDIDVATNAPITESTH